MRKGSFGLILAGALAAFGPGSAWAAGPASEIGFAAPATVVAANYTYYAPSENAVPPAPPPDATELEIPADSSLREQVQPLDQFLAQPGAGGCAPTCCAKPACCATPRCGARHGHAARCASCASGCAAKSCACAADSGCCGHHHHGCASRGPLHRAADHMLGMLFSPAGLLRANCHPAYKPSCGGHGCGHACGPVCGHDCSASCGAAACGVAVSDGGHAVAPAPVVGTPRAKATPAQRETQSVIDFADPAATYEADAYLSAPTPPAWGR